MSGSDPKTMEEMQLAIDHLAGLVTSLAADVVALHQQQEANQVRPWLTVDDPELARHMLADLVGWVRDVWSWYPAPALPDCWWLHPYAVEELWAAMGAWRAAQRKGGGWGVFADWHARTRPGVAERVARHVGDCSLALHEPGCAQPPAVRQPVSLPVDLDAAAASWSSNRASSPTARGDSPYISGV